MQSEPCLVFTLHVSLVLTNGSLKVLVLFFSLVQMMFSHDFNHQEYDITMDFFISYEFELMKIMQLILILITFNN